jgi:hypothetical protein
MFFSENRFPLFRDVLQQKLNGPQWPKRKGTKGMIGGRASADSFKSRLMRQEVSRRKLSGQNRPGNSWAKRRLLEDGFWTAVCKILCQ